MNPTPSRLRLLLCCLVLFLPAAAIGLRVDGAGTSFSGGGGGFGGVPPKSSINSPSNSGGTLVVLRLPTLINVSSSGQSSGPWVVHVRSATGVTLALASTDPSGDVEFLLPAIPGLKLDVLASDAVDVPVVAGHVVTVLLD